MHRSGTSAATRLVNLMGVPLGETADLISGSSDNPAGYWESSSLTDFNNELLGHLGGAWFAPPSLELGWQKDDSLAALETKGREAFSRVYSTAEWAWKDPRNSILLPFWLRALSTRPVIVVTLRDPSAVSWSLHRRDRFTPVYSALLWERYTRDVLTNIDGLPVIVTSFERLLADPTAWCESICGFLADQHLRVSRPDADLVREFVEHRHIEVGANRELDLTRPQRELLSLLLDVDGGHDRFKTPALPPPTEWSSVAFAEHRNREEYWSQALAERTAELTRAAARAADARADEADARARETEQQLLVAHATVNEMTERTTRLEEALIEMSNSRIFRYSAPLRRVWRSVRRLDDR
jgi:hypothetical protein